MRYRLARAITSGALDQGIGMIGDLAPGRRRVVFVMLNPSTADAFKPDPTVSRCREFARRWDADVLEVVNLFALRSTDPAELYNHERGHAGDDYDNDAAIVQACIGAQLVIAAWGKHGLLHGRALDVCKLLHRRGIETHTLGFNLCGTPKHPLARGKSFVPYERVPERWTVDWETAALRTVPLQPDEEMLPDLVAPDGRRS